MTTTPSAEPGPEDLLEAALIAMLGRPVYDQLNQLVAAGHRAEQALERVRAIPRLPHISQQTGVHGRAYTRGWQSVIDMLDQALAECCVCGGQPVAYGGYMGQKPYCWACSNCECGQDVCVRTRPDTSGHARGGPVRTPAIGDRPPGCILPVTSPDTVRTTPPPGTDTRPDGSRFAYQARVPRHLAGAALTEGLAELHRHLDQQQDTPPGRDRRREVRAAITRAFDVPDAPG
jgi:hypothetical protein